MVSAPETAGFPPTVVVVMGVSGSGKTTVAKSLSEKLGWIYQEGDELHPAANVEKMRNGIPLTDDDRWPWLHSIAALVDQWRAAGQSAVLSCSALKRAYRDIIIGDRPNVVLLYLRGSKELIGGRIAGRKHEYMPATLLDSQFATLEEPGEDERPVVIPIEERPIEEVQDAIDALKRRCGVG